MDFDYAHLKPYERAARIFCAMNEQAPDEAMPLKHPLGLQVPFSRPAWHFAAEALINLSQMLVAMRQAEAEESAAKGNVQ
jgi:hypothetical protein